jgi:superfamily II DNA/RNA helicase
MGYVPQIDEAVKLCVHPKILKFMFSATLLPEVEIMAKTMMIAPNKIIVGLKNTTVDTV